MKLNVVTVLIDSSRVPARRVHINIAQISTVDPDPDDPDRCAVYVIGRANPFPLAMSDQAFLKLVESSGPAWE